MNHQRPKHAINADSEARTKSGLHSLLMMLFGALIAMAVAIFLYFSPFFKPKATQTETLPPPIEPLTKPSESGEYEFYDILPDQEFRSVPEGVSVQSRVIEQSGELKVDTVARQDNTHNGEHSDNAPTPQRPSSNQNTAQIYQELPVNNTAPPAMQTGNAPTNNEHERIHISAVTPDVTYILQVRSFDNADEADQRRAEVIMAGVDAEVVRKTNDNGQTLYQVVSVAFINKNAATVAYRRLQNAGIDTVIVEQKHR